MSPWLCRGSFCWLLVLNLNACFSHSFYFNREKMLLIFFVNPLTFIAFTLDIVYFSSFSCLVVQISIIIIIIFFFRGSPSLHYWCMDFLRFDTLNGFKHGGYNWFFKKKRFFLEYNKWFFLNKLLKLYWLLFLLSISISINSMQKKEKKN